MTELVAKQNLFDLGFTTMADYLVELGEPKFRARQIIQWVHQHGELDFANMTNLSKSLRHKLETHAEFKLPEIALERESADGTRKWLLRLADGNAIETVFIPERDRGTLCVSSQVGCALNCSFCATGKEGFNRNLTMGEIITQLWIANKQLAKVGDQRVTNVVMMGMGEPLLNYQPVVQAMELMLDDLAYGLSKHRVTLSTSGVIPMMQKLSKDIPVALAVSLHAPNNDLRNVLVPLNKKYPLEQLMPLCREYFGKGARRVVTFEYVMLAGVNDGYAHAKQLIGLLKDVPCKVNLIPFNPFPGSNYQCSSKQEVERFRQQLINAGINAWTRKTRGDDVDGACGQLAGKVQDRTGRHKRWLKTGKLIPQS